MRGILCTRFGVAQVVNGGTTCATDFALALGSSSYLALLLLPCLGTKIGLMVSLSLENVSTARGDSIRGCRCSLQLTLFLKLFLVDDRALGSSHLFLGRG